MIKRLIAVTIAIALVLAQSTIAQAVFGVDTTTPPITAEADLSTGTPATTLTVAIKKRADDTPATNIGWSGVNLGDGWKISDHYIEVTYDANLLGWGVQIFTDNLSVSANPQYGGDPVANINQQPIGLIGVDNRLVTCPMAVLVNDATIAGPSLQLPVEQGNGAYFDTGYDSVPALTGNEIVWFWLKDKRGTEWNDANNNGILDPGEIVPNFSSTGDEYATVVNSVGASSGWFNSASGTMYRLDATSPIVVYTAAKFIDARELQSYKTNTLALELYHQ